MGIQFIHFYAPKKLRYQISDNFTVNDEESSNTKVHSPIIGWAYDGNPIYGPYGFENTDGGGVRRIETSYEVDVDLTPGVRPTSPEFIDGFFVNDYKFKGSGDLDQNNGRFCKTPEYPDGTYAYFTSVTVDTLENLNQYIHTLLENFSTDNLLVKTSYPLSIKILILIL